MMKARENPDRRVVLLTGATTGIGLALANALLATDMRLVLTARADSMPRFERLGIREGERVMLRALDVSDGDQANRVFEAVVARWGGVDVLINNAAISYRAVMEHLTDADEEEQFQVNYLGPLHLIRLVLPGMRARRRGHIVNLSSVGGMMAMPTMGGYSASKFALEGASEALWYECRPWGVRVVLVEPGFVRSDSFRNARFSKQSQRAYSDGGDPYHRYYANMIGFIERMMRRSPTTPQDIARRILRILKRKRPPLRVFATWDAFFFSFLRRALPKRLYHVVLYRFLPRIGEWVAPAPKAAASDRGADK